MACSGGPGGRARAAFFLSTGPLCFLPALPLSHADGLAVSRLRRFARHASPVAWGHPGGISIESTFCPAAAGRAGCRGCAGGEDQDRPGLAATVSAAFLVVDFIGADCSVWIRTKFGSCMGLMQFSIPRTFVCRRVRGWAGASVLLDLRSKWFG